MADTVWFDLAEARAEIGFDAGDTADDALLTDYGDKGNRIIDNLIFPYKDTLPATGGDITEDLKGACLMYVVYRYHLHREKFDLANEYKKDYKDTLFGDPDNPQDGGVVARLRAIPEARTQRVIVSSSYKTSPLKDE
jgi:hypothetical protein